jgi:hypothetical protein
LLQLIPIEGKEIDARLRFSQVDTESATSTRTGAAAEDDYERSVLTGLYAELANDRFTLIAADSYCLALR